MIYDLNEYEDGAVIEADLAVIGGGAAGITIAHELAGSSREVLLVESGGTEFDAETQALYEGRNVGTEYYDLDIARLRFFGGSTNHWDGHCRPLDPIDFKRRDWVPHSGWPITRAGLDPYYARAQKLCELGPYRYEAEDWPTLRPELLDLTPSKLVNRFWQIGPPTRFGEVYREVLQSASNVDILTYANIVDILLDEAGNAVEHAVLKTLGGKTVTLRPQALVLACGGIENARILLSCDSQHKAGLGNGHDVVGRYFMEHPHALAAYAVRDGVDLEKFTKYFDIIPYAGTHINVRPGVTEDVQQRLGILNSCLDVGYGYDLSDGYLAVRDLGGAMFRGRATDSLWDATLDVIRDLNGAVGGVYRRLRKEDVLWFAAKSEQAPDPESRVTLDRERDALGMRRPRLDWRLSAMDKQSVAETCKLVGEELARLGVARTRLSSWVLEPNAEWRNVTGRYHHIGTTRMSDSPRHGVVDRDCRVHGIANLYMAGSSVFPTSGYTNPTLTIVALAVRLAEHLKPRT